jgi:hypothetical protein
MVLQQRVAKIKGVADIVFCIDFSQSMSSCIKGVKDHVSTFVHSIETGDPNKAIDWRIAFIGYSASEFLVSPFMSDPASFANRLSSARPSRSDEFTAGAIDYCLSEMEWRDGANKFIVVFTDETLKGGFTGEGMVEERFPALLQKTAESRAFLFYFGPNCPYYNQFKQYARGRVTIVEDDFSSVKFEELFSFLGKTVSNSTGQGQAASEKLPMVYDLRDILITSV